MHRRLSRNQWQLRTFGVVTFLSVQCCRGGLILHYPCLHDARRPPPQRSHPGRRLHTRCFLRDEKPSQLEDSTTTTTKTTSQGIVSSLTNFVNALFSSPWVAIPPSLPRSSSSSDAPLAPRPATSPEELRDRIQNDYKVRNHLWTGDIDLPCFDPNCRFQDPTLSFSGTATFVRNLKNLRPIVDFLTQQQTAATTTTDAKDSSRPQCRSDLLEIELVIKDEATQKDVGGGGGGDSRSYIQTRWNMVGELKALPWKPKIDVIGRTKFWFRGRSDDSGGGGQTYTVYFYDEEWEIPAGRALLQLITPPGTIANQ